MVSVNKIMRALYFREKKLILVLQATTAYSETLLFVYNNELAKTFKNIEKFESFARFFN